MVTKEELLAEEYICNGKCQDDITKKYVHCKTCTRLNDFLTGLKAGRPKWHDLRKDKYDLPEDTYDVFDQAGYKVHYNFFQNVWVNEKDEIDEHVIAWCEIPQFEE